MRLIKRDISCIFTLKKVIIIIASAIIIGELILANIPYGNYSSMDVIFKFLAGPNVRGEAKNNTEILIWLSTQIVFLTILGQFLYDEFRFNYIYSILRIKSKTSWVISKMVSILIFTLVYYGIYLCVIYLLSNVALKNHTLRFNQVLNDFSIFMDYIGSEEKFILYNMTINILSTYLNAMIFFIINVITLNVRWTFISVLVYEIISISITGPFNLVNNSFLSERYWTNISDKFSIFYLLLTIIFVCVISIIVVNFKENLEID